VKAESGEAGRPSNENDGPLVTVPTARLQYAQLQAAAQEKRVMASPNVLELTTDNFDTEVKSGTLVVADFWAPWCGPCRQLSPVIDRVADQFAGKVKVGKVNVDENNDLAIKYEVATIPRVLIFKGSDQPVFQHVGTISDIDLSKVIQEHM
jgi:thioredoxin 1